MAKIDVVRELEMRRTWDVLKMRMVRMDEEEKLDALREFWLEYGDVVKGMIVAWWDMIEPMIASSFLTIWMIWEDIQREGDERVG